MKRFPACCILICLALAGAPRAGQVTLRNGDRISGDIVRCDDRVLTVETELMGTVSVPLEAVAALSSDQTLYLGLDDGRTVAGSVALEEGELWVRAPAADPMVLPRESVRSIRSEEEEEAWLAEAARYRDPGLLELWGGYVETGFSLAAGNSDTLTFTTGLNATRQTPRDKTSVYIQSLYAHSGTGGASETTASAVRGGGRYEIFLNERLTAFGYGDIEHDEFQKLNLRLVPGAGLGYYLVQRDDAQFQVFSGINLNQEYFVDDPDRTSGEVKLGQELFTRLTSRFGLRQRFSLYPNITESGVYRFVFDTSAVAALNKWLAWHVSFNDRFVSNPAPGAESNDILLTTGLRVNFRR
jgi:hypothetical protein